MSWWSFGGSQPRLRRKDSEELEALVTDKPRNDKKPRHTKLLVNSSIPLHPVEAEAAFVPFKQKGLLLYHLGSSNADLPANLSAGFCQRHALLILHKRSRASSQVILTEQTETSVVLWLASAQQLRLCIDVIWAAGLWTACKQLRWPF